MSAKSLDNLMAVFHNGLCARCGTCVGLSEGAVCFGDKSGCYLPELKEKISDELAKRILKGCSGRDVCFNELNEFIFGGGAERHPYMGHVKEQWIGFANSADLRRKCASGGIISSVLMWLIENKEINGAVVLGMDEEKPWRPKPYIATSSDEIVRASQSKYVITSVNEILPDIEKFQGWLAYVGLPCQVHSIRKLQLAGDSSVRNIKYVVGPYCGNTLHFSSIKSLLRSYGEKDYSQIKSIAFREGEWPGTTRIELRSGRVISLPKFHANYLIPFHIMKRCLLCTDLTNEFTDISVGDAWAPAYEERGKGFSLVLARSEKGQEILYTMKDEGLISLDKLESKAAVSMHSHGYDLKKRGAFIRIRFRKFFGRAVPNYGYELKGFPVKRYLMEILIDFMFALMGTSLASFLLEKIHPKFMGGVFKKLRTIWKKLTHNIKREEFYVDKW